MVLQTPNETERIRNLPNRLAFLIATTHNDQMDLFQIHPFRNELDVRVTIYAKALNALIPAHLSLYFLSEQLFDSNWWVSRDVPFYDAEGLPIILDEYEKSIKTHLLLAIFQVFESSFRILLNAISTSQRIRHIPFKTVYDRLFKLANIPDRKAAVNTFDLLRTLRNSVHTNTVYDSKKMSDFQIIWNGKSFQFKHGYPITFLTWDLMIDLLNECRIVVTSIIMSQKVSSLPSLVTDPYSME